MVKILRGKAKVKLRYKVMILSFCFYVTLFFAVSKCSCSVSKFGYETEGSNKVSIEDCIRGSWFTCPEDGYAINISAFIRVPTYPGTTICAGIYKFSDDSLVAQTEEEEDVPQALTGAWVTFSFTWPLPNLEGGVDYWLVVWANEASELYYDGGTLNGTAQTLNYTGTFPDSLNGSLNSFVHSIYCTYGKYSYNFNGLYNEATGNLETGGVDVTAYFTDGTPPETFHVDGNQNHLFNSKPQYFLFDLVKDREYWLEDGEYETTIYIFNDTLTTYTIDFLDLAGVTDDRPILEAKYYVNGTLYTVEKRKVDVEPKIVMNLVNGRKYTLLLKDGSSYTFGELLMTSTTTITLTFKGLEFPEENLLTFRWVRIHCGRRFATPNGSIAITYNDTLTQTAKVDIYIRYRNGTYVYNATETADSFFHNWTVALNNTDYRVEAIIDHATLGTLTARWFVPRELSGAPWGMDFLGTLPFDTSSIIPLFIILCFAGLFSALNAPMGAFVAVIVTAIFVWMGWLSISGGLLIAAFAFAIMLAIIYAKRRANV